MKWPVPLLVGCFWMASAALSVPRADSLQNAPSRPAPDPTPYRAVVNQYCLGCHNQRAKAGGLTLDSVDIAKIPEHPEVWEKVVRKLRTGAMPPFGSRRPDEATYDRMATWLEAELDGSAAAKPNPGKPGLLHRLNRAEYANAIHDLLALDVNTASLLPPDDAAYGFDNIADALGVSPMLLERYLVAADKISALAVGDPETTLGAETYRARGDLSQDRHLEALPLGTVGGMLVHHMFPLDGEYLFQVKLFRTNSSVVRGLESPQQIEFMVDGERIHLAQVGGTEDFQALLKDVTAAGDAIDARLQVRVRVKAGPHDVGVAFIQKSAVAGTRVLQPYVRSSADTYDFTGRPHVDSLTVTGPYNAGPPGDTPSRRRVFMCRPADAAHEDACAKTIVSTLARRAYRRPVVEADLRPLLEFYQAGRRGASFERGIQAALQRILASPMFVFRGERNPANLAPGSVYRLSDVELASQLSFFLWSSIPDEELLKVASQGKLSTPAVLEQQVRRLLSDPRAEALVDNFAGQWLQLRNLKSVAPNSDEFPDFDDNLRQAFQREAELLFESVMREDRKVLDLLTADYTFVNERLAKHYKIPNVYGSQFRRVPVTEEARKGLLGKGAILLVTSHSDRTSPVVRGKWILENLLGTPPPPPPPDVPALDEKNEGKTMRQRMEVHRANAACATCHKLMDPLGFALENFDAVGAWRTNDAGTPIDASGQLTDGTQVDGVVTLRQALLKRPEVFVDTLTEKLLTYALGRGLSYYDMPAVRGIVRESARHDYRFSSIILGIVNSKSFQMRFKPLDGPEPVRTAAR